MQIRILIALLFLTFIIGCSPKEENQSAPVKKIPDNSTFDPEKWKIREDKSYPYREAMLEDLMNNQNIRSLRHKEIISLLGQPDRTDSAYVFYKVDETRVQLFVLNSKTLVIKFNPDSTVKWVKTHG